jgi:hypothetical protein
MEKDFREATQEEIDTLDFDNPEFVITLPEGGEYARLKVWYDYVNDCTFVYESGGYMNADVFRIAGIEPKEDLANFKTELDGIEEIAAAMRAIIQPN